MRAGDAGESVCMWQTIMHAHKHSHMHFRTYVRSRAHTTTHTQAILRLDH